MGSENLESLKKQLDSNIPEDAVSEREQAGLRLSYLEGWYVIDRLNQVLGQGNWQYETDTINKVHETSAENARGQKGRTVSYMAIVRLTAVIAERTVSFTDVGFGSGIEYGNRLTADESAGKEAVTDGLKRCAKNLGRSLGLALYDKEQRYVGDVAETTKAEVPKQEEGQIPSSPPPALSRERIRATFNVLQGKGKLTKEQFQKTYLAPTKKEKVADLSETEASALLNQLSKDYKEVLNAR